MIIPVEPPRVVLDLASSPPRTTVATLEDGTGGLPPDHPDSQEVALMQIEAEMLDTAIQLSAIEAAAKETVDTPSPTKTAIKLDDRQEKEYQASNAVDPEGMAIAMANAEMELKKKWLAQEQADANAGGDQYSAAIEAAEDDAFHLYNSMENIMDARAQYRIER